MPVPVVDLTVVVVVVFAPLAAVVGIVSNENVLIQRTTTPASVTDYQPTEC